MITRKSAICQMFILLVSSLIFLYSCFKARSSKVKNAYIYRDLISEISAMIVPQTDTPGAREAGVGIYIINIVESCLSDVRLQTNLDT